MGKMKRIVAACVVYIMTIMLLPVNTMIAYANQGEVPKFLEISDLYVNSIAQFGNKSLISYQSEDIW